MSENHGALILASILALASCSENPATGKQQFTALMPASQEASVGASEHQKAVAQYGVYSDAALQSKLNAIGQKLAKGTERGDVKYTFTLLDSPIINAFALPGGYVYVTRGLMAWANSEAELAGVIAHEIGHVTARHSAARYSQSAVASLGLQILGATVKTPGLNQAAGLGANLYLSQYSQSQEHESDDLGIRYLTRAGYDPMAMADFLEQLNRSAAYESQVKGQAQGQGLNQFFSSHPSTPARVARSRAAAQAATAGGTQERDSWLRSIDGLVWGDSAKDGYVRGSTFVHPQMGFAFDALPGSTLQNGKNAVVGTTPDGVTTIFDMGQKPAGQSLGDYIANWTKGGATGIQATTINGKAAAAGQVPNGNLNGKSVSVHVIAIEGSNGNVYRFQYAVPPSLAANAQLQADIQKSARSFRTPTQAEANMASRRIRVVTASGSDSVQSLGARMNVSAPDNKEALFRALNGMNGGDNVVSGRLYKIVQ